MEAYFELIRLTSILLPAAPAVLRLIFFSFPVLLFAYTKMPTRLL